LKKKLEEEEAARADLETEKKKIENNSKDDKERVIKLEGDVDKLSKDLEEEKKQHNALKEKLKVLFG
jgi:hypothetical protein